MNWVDPLGLAGKVPKTKRDSLGRLKEAEVTVTEDMLGKGTNVNKSARDYARSLGNADDDAGHILGKALGGKGGKDNVFPQLPSTNRGEFRMFESRVRDEILTNGPLDLKWKFDYIGNSTRPSGIIYEGYRDGKLILDRTFGN